MSLQKTEIKKGLLLVNLGTPEAPAAKQVRKYLKEFLMDPWVLDIPGLFRWILVNGVILPTRSVSSALAYQKIWTTRGSPLLFHLMDLASGVEKKLGEGWVVKPAMRYGSPSIRTAIQELHDSQTDEIFVLPLYPQYSLAATESSVQECLKWAKKIAPNIKLKIMEPFYDTPAYLHSFAEIIRDSLENFSYDHLLFSFHGLPERHVKKTDPSHSHCLVKENCCDQIGEVNKSCYRAQCYQTAKKISAHLGIPESRYTVCFQSRLGGTPWIKPYTDEFYRQLPKKGIKRLAVACPAFVADCLETLEEVKIRGKEEFIQNGGEDLKMIPSLNASKIWVDSLAELILRSS